MADEKRNRAGEQPQDEGREETANPRPRQAMLRLVGFVAVLMIVEALVISLLAGRSGSQEVASADELEIGAFQFRRPDAEQGGVREARFQLHVRIFPDLIDDASATLGANRFHVREGVEEVLRQAAPSDFEDPLLVELKRRIQERINTDLGQRAVARCIVTHLQLERNTLPSLPSAEELTGHRHEATPRASLKNVVADDTQRATATGNN